MPASEVSRRVAGWDGVVDIVEGRGVGQRYGRRWVLRALTFSVGPGLTALLGPNGAGKTTLLHIVTGLRRATAGKVRVFGNDVATRAGRPAVAARLGFLPQTAGFYPNFTLRESVAYAAWLKRVPRDMVPGFVAEALAKVALTDRADSKMRTLSGGMLHRAGIAQAIVHRPELLVLDEPAAGLDPEQRIELRLTIRKMAESSAVFLSTHVVEDIRHLADQVLILHDGRLAFVGTIDDLAGMAQPGERGDSDLEQGYLSVLRHWSGGDRGGVPG